MIYLPGLYDYDWQTTIVELYCDPDYPVWAFIEFCTTMQPFGVN